MEVVNALGRRKRAIARIFVSEGTGKITINKRDLAEYFPSTILDVYKRQKVENVRIALLTTVKAGIVRIARDLMPTMKEANARSVRTAVSYTHLLVMR